MLRSHPVFVANPLGDWEEIVGPQAAAASRPVSLKDGALMVIVRDAMWRHQLEMSQAVLLSRINGEREEALVQRLVIRVGELPESEPALNPNRKLLERKTPRRKGAGIKNRKAPRRSLTTEEKAFLKTIEDLELRRIGRRLLQLSRLDEE